MNYERESYMRAQDAHHDMLRMRTRTTAEIRRGIASVGRNAERQDAQRLGPKDEHAVPEGQTPKPQSVSTKKGA